MEYHGFKIDLVGLGSAISAIVALIYAVRGQKKKEKENARKDKTDEA